MVEKIILSLNASANADIWQTAQERLRTAESAVQVFQPIFDEADDRLIAARKSAVGIADAERAFDAVNVTYGALCDRLHEAQCAALKCPVETAADLAEKVELFAAVEARLFNDVDAILAGIAADARRLGGRHG